MEKDNFDFNRRTYTTVHSVPKMTYSRRNRSIVVPSDDVFAFKDRDEDEDDTSEWLKGKRIKRKKDSDATTTSSSQHSQKSSPSLLSRSRRLPKSRPNGLAVTPKTTIALPIVNAPQKPKASPRKRTRTIEPLTEHVNESWLEDTTVIKDETYLPKRMKDIALSSSPDELQLLPLKREVEASEKATKRISFAKTPERNESTDITGPLACSTPNAGVAARQTNLFRIEDGGVPISPIAEHQPVLPPMNKKMRSGITVYRDVPDVISPIKEGSNPRAKASRAKKSVNLKSVVQSHVRSGKNVKRDKRRVIYNDDEFGV
ncbi:hypothetical protein V1512DRAFT_280883 [Lipomyces arxii]|uniref:uncharacterized protein n=1 Tax=Lipomyces arxii TaxID=56418 RepID=UPI0034CEF64C